MGRWRVSVVRLGRAALPFQAPGVSVRICEHVMRSPVAKLLDFEPQLAGLPHHANPFALLTAAHLTALRIRADVDLLDPKNDYVFKRLFADSPELLAELISAVRKDEPPLEVLQVLNPHILPEDLTGKPIELDVLARDSTGHLFNVEVQVLRYPRWSARSTFYLARMLSTQIDAGQHYLALKPVVGVHLLDFDLVDGHPSALWQFEMRDRHHPSVRLGDELTLFVVALPKADRLLRARAQQGSVATDADAHTAAALEAWIKFFKHWKEAQAMSDLSYPPVQQAMKKLQDLSRNEEDRYRALARDKALYDELSLLNDAREEGREKGREEGRKATLARLLNRRFGPLPHWVDSRLQQATPAQLDTWLDRVLDASTLEAALGNH